MSDSTSQGRQAIDRLFSPKSIALVGASERSIWAVAAADNLKRSGFEGPVHMINPKGGTIFGQTAATSCAAVGETIDAALLMVPEAALVDAFEDLGRAGVGGAVILSAGFAELGEDGAARQRQIAQVAREAGIRILGPNCLGYANFVANTAIWTTPLRRPMPGATIAVVSQSGAIASQLEQFAYQQRIGLTHMISTGNEADVNIADAIEYLARQPEPGAIALFLESVREPERFVRAVEAATAAGKPLVLLKVGSSEATARAAQAHTGSLVGNDRVFDALCRRLGIARVRSLEELIITTDLFARLDPAPGAATGLALVAMSGGLCEIVTDQAEIDEVAIPQLADDTLARLREALPPLATPANPLDVTGAAMREPELIARSVAAIAQDPSIGMIAFVFDAPLKDDKRGFARRFIEQVGAGFRDAGKPCLMISHAFTAVNGEARAMTDESGVVYSGGGVRHCLSAIGHLLNRGTAGRFVAETEQPNAPRPDGERAVLEHLAAHGVPIVPAVLAGSADEAVAAARSMDAAVVLKIASPDIQHKTEVGGVALNLRGDEAVRNAYETTLARVGAAKPAAKIDGVIVSPMRGTDSGLELFVGTMRDPQWGPSIAVGLGGVWIEALKDSSLRLLPVTRDDALAMLRELRASSLLDGFRGAAPVDRAALADIVVAIGDAALALGPELVSLEVNPLLAAEGRIEALDGLAVWEESDEHA